MSEEKIKKISFSPIAMELTYAILKTIRNRNLSSEGRYVLDADLVPRVSERVMNKSISGIREFKRDMTPIVNLEKKQAVPEKHLLQNRKQSFIPQRRIPNKGNIMRSFAAQRVGPTLSPEGEYGKIQIFLEDPSISTIECTGPDKPLTIVRAGQREFTRINLNTEDIKDTLEKVSESAHIPLFEGVFSAAVDNFTINAVVSDMIGSRFIIKKQTPYSLLE